MLLQSTQVHSHHQHGSSQPKIQTHRDPNCFPGFHKTTSYLYIHTKVIHEG